MTYELLEANITYELLEANITSNYWRLILLTNLLKPNVTYELVDKIINIQLFWKWLDLTSDLTTFYKYVTSPNSFWMPPPCRFVTDWWEGNVRAAMAAAAASAAQGSSSAAARLATRQQGTTYWCTARVQYTYIVFILIKCLQIDLIVTCIYYSKVLLLNLINNIV